MSGACGWISYFFIESFGLILWLHTLWAKKYGWHSVYDYAKWFNKKWARIAYIHGWDAP